jgi:phage head maturation protease
LERGDITQASWAFDINMNGDKWVYDQEKRRDVRTITNVRNVYDASPVTHPANPDTSVAARSLECGQG